jgi:hypothetical protein
MRPWTNKDGQAKESWGIVVSDVKFQEPKPGQYQSKESQEPQEDCPF